MTRVRVTGAPPAFVLTGSVDSDVMERRKAGRPSKGDRCMVAARLPRPLADAARKHAAERGMTFNDLVGELLAAEVGTPYETQEVLPRSA